MNRICTRSSIMVRHIFRQGTKNDTRGRAPGACAHQLRGNQLIGPASVIIPDSGYKNKGVIIVDQGLIIVKQLPIIEDQLAAVKESIQKRVEDACSLVCTEENVKQIKGIRAELNKEYAELESRRKEVKAAVMAPYEKFEAVYKDCAGEIYVRADKQLKDKIAEVEDGLKVQKQEKLEQYFAEYRESVGIATDFICFEDTRIKVGLSDSLTSLKKKIKAGLDKIAEDLKAISAQEDADEVLAEYRRNFNLPQALSIVAERHEAIEKAKREREEAEKKRREQEEQEKKIAEAAHVSETPKKAEEEKTPAPDEAFSAPVAKPIENEEKKSETYAVEFRVSGTLQMLKKLKAFLIEGGYSYEQL